MKIANKISLSFFITAVTLTGIATPIFYTTARKNLENAILSHLSTTVQSRTHHIETVLETGKEAIKQLSESIVIERFLLTSKKDEDYNQKLNDAMRRLKYTAGIMKCVYEIFVLNEDGIIVASSGGRDIGKDKSSDFYFVGGREGVFVKDAYISQDKKINSIAFSAPLFDEENIVFLGLVVAEVSMDEINRITEDRTGLGKTGEVYLVNKDGYMVTISRFIKDTFLKLKVDTENTRKCFEDIKKFGSEPCRHVPFTYRDYRGVKVLGIHDHIPQMNWALLAKIDAKEALAPLAKIKLLFVIIMIFVPIAAWLIGVFVSRIISRPIHKLHIGTKIIGEGNLDYRVGTDTKDEIGQLSRAFDKMSEDSRASHLRLKESHKQLEEKVKERTTKLSSANVELESEVEQRRVAQKTLEERIKELNCLFGLSKLVEQPGIPLEEILEETVDLIRNAYQKPDKTCARITFEGVQHKTDNFEKSESSQHAEIKVRGEEAGDIEVYYLREKAENGQGPFLKEEQDLLDAVAKHLGSVAERKRTGEKLQLFRNLIDQSNDSVFIIEPQWGRFVDVNDRACDSLGYKREELLDMSLKDIDESIPDDSSWAKHIKEIRRKGSMVLESRSKRKNGTTFPIEVNIKLISQGREDFLIAVARDITERKKAQEALRKSERKYRTLLENLPQNIFSKDKDSIYISCNENFARELGIKPEEFKGKTDYDFFPKELAEKYRADDKRIIETGKTEDIEEKYIKDGQEIIVHTVKTPIRDEQDNVVGVLGIFWDVTALKQAEEKQAELLQQVESVNRELKDFAYIVSHDLKAPLRGIKTLADWISTDYADKLDEEGRERVNMLLERVVRMHNLIDGVLQYSRVRHEKLKRVRANLNELVSEVIEMIAPPENIEITVENEMPVVECEETRIMQVFQNLLSNAVKYMDKPQGQITIGCVQENGFWKFSVADNGPGIEEKHFEKIFQIFQTLSPRDEFESTGVGLSVVKKIVELFGGKIWVESKPGEGSTFFFTLPKQESEVVDDAQLEANIVS